MYRVLSCLSSEHDFRLVVLAALICAGATFTAFKIYSHALTARSMQQLGWVLLSGVCTGSGIWATHFVAMLAYSPGFPITYEPVATTTSLLIAVLVTSAGFSLATGSHRWHAGAGGAVIGAGIGAMHYTGMHALVVPGILTWDSALIFSSLVIGITLSSIAMIQYRRRSGLRAIGVAAGLLTAAICGLHFTAMGAVIIIPDPTIIVHPSQMDNSKMALAVAGVSFLVMLSGLAAALIETQTSRERENELQAQNQRFETALSNMLQGLCMMDAERRLVICNRRYADMYGLPAELTRPGTPMSEILEHRIASGLYSGASAADYRRERRAVSRANAHSTTIQELNDGRVISVTHQPMADGGAVATHEDVTELRRTQARIAHLVHHDALTGLPNRVLLHARLESALNRPPNEGAVAVLCLDLDGFKEINDTLGHPIGDLLLKQVAGRLRGSVAERDTVARIGGDGFAVVQFAPGQPKDARALADSVIAAIGAPFDLDGHQAVVEASVGISVAPTDGTDPDQLLRNADLALHRAKREARGSHRFFEEEMNARMQSRRSLESDLRRALGNGEFKIYYQPIINLERNEISGFEALLRWHHPLRGSVSPGDFIPLAEETGLIVPIGEWVLRQACADAVAWPDHIDVAVNLSAVQFKNRDPVRTVLSALAASGLRPTRLELEITETVLLQDSKTTVTTLHRLRDLGVRIAMDDFGTGYSSLSYLRSFPFDKIKIDGSFIADLSKDAGSLAIVGAAATLGNALGMTTTAEGVETKDQLEWVRAKGCTEAQGYYFSAAKPADEIASLLATLCVTSDMAA